MSKKALIDVDKMDNEDLGGEYQKSVLQGDHQYNQLIGENKGRSQKSNIELDPKYQGATKDQIGESELEESYTDEDDENVIENYKKFEQEQQLTQKDQKLNNMAQDIINQMYSEEDETHQQQLQQNQQQEYQKANNYKEQLDQYQQIIYDRVQLQKSLDLVNQYPYKQVVNNVQDEKILSNQNFIEMQILQQIQNTNCQLMVTEMNQNENFDQQIEEQIKQQYRIMENVAFQIKDEKVKRKEIQSYQVNSDKLLEEFTQSLNKLSLEEEIFNWSQRVSFQNISNFKQATQSQLMQTPIGQTEKQMKQVEKLILKSQLRNQNIIGSNTLSAQDTEIYNDFDFYSEILKSVQNSGENLLQGGQKSYILQRQNKIKKNVDRKASKHRKIRYDVHQKLVNFMTPQPNEDLLFNREKIIKSLFGHQNQCEQKIEEENLDIAII